MVCLDIRYKIRKDGKFWFVECLDYPVFTQGRTKEEAKENLKEAFLLYAEDADAQAIHLELKRVSELLNKPAAPSLPVKLGIVLNIQDTFAALSPIYEPFANFIGNGSSQNPV